MNILLSIYAEMHICYICSPINETFGKKFFFINFLGLNKIISNFFSLYYSLDFGSWSTLDELNLGTNQLSELPGNNC